MSSHHAIVFNIRKWQQEIIHSLFSIFRHCHNNIHNTIQYNQAKNSTYIHHATNKFSFPSFFGCGSACVVGECLHDATRTNHGRIAIENRIQEDSGLDIENVGGGRRQEQDLGRRNILWRWGMLVLIFLISKYPSLIRKRQMTGVSMLCYAMPVSRETLFFSIPFCSWCSLRLRYIFDLNHR